MTHRCLFLKKIDAAVVRLKSVGFHYPDQLSKCDVATTLAGAHYSTGCTPKDMFDLANDVLACFKRHLSDPINGAIPHWSKFQALADFDADHRRAAYPAEQPVPGTSSDWSARRLLVASRKNSKLLREKDTPPSTVAAPLQMPQAMQGIHPMALIQMGMLMSNSGTASSDQLQMLQTMCGGGAVTRHEDGGLPGFKMTIPPRRTGNVLNGRAIEAGTRSANSPGEHSDGADSVAALFRWRWPPWRRQCRRGWLPWLRCGWLHRTRRRRPGRSCGYTSVGAHHPREPC